MFEAINDWLKDFRDNFKPGPDTRLSSPITAIVRFLLRFIYAVIPVIYIGLVIALVTVEEQTIVSALVSGILSTVVAVLLLAVFIAILMVFESFAKVIVILITYNEVPSSLYESENPIDEFVYYTFEKKVKK